MSVDTIEKIVVSMRLSLWCTEHKRLVETAFVAVSPCIGVLVVGTEALF